MHFWQWRASTAKLPKPGPRAGGRISTIIRFNTATGDYDRAAMDRQKSDESMGGAANAANPLAHGAPSSTLV